jgi:glycosyltransferase involved in cell wall biosynthesis
MYPGPEDPDLGVFVANLERELAARGHVFERAVVDRRRGGRRRHLGLMWDAFRAARRFRPDVVYAHFLVPAGLAAALASRAPLVVTAHGQDVENARTSRLARRATRYVVRRSAAVIAVSEWLRGRLADAVPEAIDKTKVIDCGVDLERFLQRDAAAARSQLGLDAAGTAFLCLGTLSERKNVLRLASAFERRGEGTLTFVGDGPLRGALEGRVGIRLVGRVEHDAVPAWIDACDVLCQPSLVEPFGLATLEGMASARSVVASRVGGPPEFVPPDAGVLVDPEDEDALVAALDFAAGLPRPNLAARAAAEAHDVKRQAERVEAILERAVRDRPA